MEADAGVAEEERGVNANNHVGCVPRTTIIGAWDATYDFTMRNVETGVPRC